MKEIILTKNKVTIVDDDDFDWLNQWKWHFNTGYASRSISRDNKRFGIQMHRLIMSAKIGQNIDHIDRNKLNNSRKNLRFASDIENACNVAKIKKICSSKYKGVHYRNDRCSKNWMVTVKFNGVRYYGGSYNTEIEAAMAYNIFAKKIQGNFSFLNIIT